MIVLGLLVVELFGLFLLSRWLTKTMYILFYVLSRSRTVAVSLMSTILFPGTVIHELSHLFTAEILGVKTGKLSLIPENINEKEIRAGSVQIASTDPFRRYLIGFAPIITGTISLFCLSYFLPQLWQDVTRAAQNRTLFISPSWYIFIIVGYLIFTISNTMFTSREDTRGFLPFALIIAAFVASAYALGLRIQISGVFLQISTTAVSSLGRSLFAVLALNIIMLLTMKVFIAIIRKMFRITINFS